MRCRPWKRFFSAPMFGRIDGRCKTVRVLCLTFLGSAMANRTSHREIFGGWWWRRRRDPKTRCRHSDERMDTYYINYNNVPLYYLDVPRPRSGSSSLCFVMVIFVRTYKTIYYNNIVYCT